MSHSSNLSKSYGRLLLSELSLTKASATQTGSSASDINVDAVAGKMTTVSLTAVAGASEIFAMINQKVKDDSVVIVSVSAYSGTGLPVVSVGSVVAGEVEIVINNAHSADPFNAALEISFLVV